MKVHCLSHPVEWCVERTLRSLEEYLGAQGYSTLAAADAAAARTLCAKRPIDLALLDIHMPGEDGLSLARYLREHYRMAIVILTSAGTVVDRIVGLEIGADDYIPKPFDPRELLARIKSVLRRTSFSEQAKGARVAYFLLDSARNIPSWPLNFLTCAA